MKGLRVIDALQLPEVLAGSSWIDLHTLQGQTLGVDPVRGRMYWCDGTYHPAADPPSYFSGEARLSLSQLFSLCTLITAPSNAPCSPRK